MAHQLGKQEAEMNVMISFEPFLELGVLRERRDSAKIYALPHGIPGIGRKKVLRARAWAQRRGPTGSLSIPGQPHSHRGTCQCPPRCQHPVDPGFSRHGESTMRIYKDLLPFSQGRICQAQHRPHHRTDRISGTFTPCELSDLLKRKPQHREGWLAARAT